ncbi:ABC-type transport auxiliary lipoprotein family protein [Candidatus Liberibacter asiaticus]|uniref:ABC transporter protein n=3 Tax=Liberibacter asiaticus TaxID=34021 RepID=A0ABM5NEV8_LIBAS|nr:ABC-type transport auxiliary lipoprotein family protein [Candidatus Liberibacter asiaticus]ACT56614.1 putative ABC transporter protein [Candidatus Liberibacter asiaticus str. psy62]AGH16382.1 putative ABC transporter protein [Candidatus Liberibacter asiaticus str. gxpsy]ALK06805.1 ABC transporter [Candidatus Liberibacter asiaticus]ASK52270.1 ABC transporter [Candidatus Liberibacter asiaticus]AWL13588.1 ABC transporter [Candidatus Liberibacter asiaticus]
MDKKLNKIIKKKIISCSLAVLLCTSLSSCFFHNNPVNIYDLTESTKYDESVQRHIQLIITEPITEKILNSEDIIVRSSPIEIQYLIGSQWSDKLPRMIQLKLIANFENNGKISTVVKPNQGIYADYQIISAIRSFEINIDRHCAIITMSLKIINAHDNSLVGQKVFHVEEKLEKDNKLHFIQSLNRAFSRISSEIIDWTLSSLPLSDN